MNWLMVMNHEIIFPNIAVLIGFIIFKILKKGRDQLKVFIN